MQTLALYLIVINIYLCKIQRKQGRTMKKKLIISKLILIGIILFSNYSYGQNTIINTYLKDRALFIHFNTTPSFSSELSDSKTQITFKFDKRIQADTNLNKLSSSIINKISLNNYDDNSILNIHLNSKRGFTHAILPYSNTLLINIIDWKNLTSDEDFYQTGLLGLDIIEAAKENFQNAVDGGNKKAAFFLAVQYLKEGKINSAEQLLLFSLKDTSPLFDSYACLSQVYTIKNNTFLSKKFKEIFSELTGLKNINSISISKIIETDTIFAEDMSYILKDSLNPEDFLIDLPNFEADSSKNEVLSAKNDSLIKTDALFKIENIFPVWMKFALWIFLAVVLLLSYFYLKWRQEQLKVLQKHQKETFSNELDSAKKSTKKKTIPKNLHRKIKGDNDIVNPYNKEQNAKKSELEAKDKNAVESFISGLRPPVANKDHINIPAQKKNDIDLDIPSLNKNKTGIGANVEMAMNIAQEQQRIREKNIKSIEKEQLNSSKEALEKIAKELGVDKGSIETKKALQDLNNDSDTFSKLADKFNAKKSNPKD